MKLPYELIAAVARVVIAEDNYLKLHEGFEERRKILEDMANECLPDTLVIHDMPAEEVKRRFIKQRWAWKAVDEFRQPHDDARTAYFAARSEAELVFIKTCLPPLKEGE